MQRWSAVRVHYLQTGASSLTMAMMLTTYTLFRVEVAGLTALEVVLTATAKEAATFLFEIPTGVVADVYSRRLSVIIGVAITALAMIAQAAMPSFAMILAMLSLWGLGRTFISGAYEAWLVDEVGQARAGEAFVRGAQIGQIGRLAGIGLSMALGSISLALPIFAGGALTGCMCLFLIVCMPETGFKPTPAAERTTWQRLWETFASAARLIRQRPVLMSLLGISLFSGLYSEGWDQLWQVHLVETIGLPVRPALPAIVWVGLLMLVQSLFAVGMGEAIRRRVKLADSEALARVLRLMILGMVGGLMTYGIAQSFGVGLAAYFTFTMLRSVSQPLLSTWTNQHIEPAVRATVLSVQSQAHAMGEIAGGPPLGAIGQTSLRLVFVASALLLSPVVPLMGRARRQGREQAAVGVAPTQAA